MIFFEMMMIEKITTCCSALKPFKNEEPSYSTSTTLVSGVKKPLLLSFRILNPAQLIGRFINYFVIQATAGKSHLQIFFPFQSSAPSRNLLGNDGSSGAPKAPVWCCYANEQLP
jgi:hypothetical protein